MRSFDLSAAVLQRSDVGLLGKGNCIHFNGAVCLRFHVYLLWFADLQESLLSDKDHSLFYCIYHYRNISIPYSYYESMLLFLP